MRCRWAFAEEDEAIWGDLRARVICSKWARGPFHLQSASLSFKQSQGTVMKASVQANGRELSWSRDHFRTSSCWPQELARWSSMRVLLGLLSFARHAWRRNGGAGGRNPLG